MLSDDVGIIQHAVETVPNRSTGYCTDDVARALMVMLQRLHLDPDDADAGALASRYLSFLHDAQLSDGRFHNFMSYARTWLDDVGTHDSCGRAMWALGYTVRHAATQPWRRVAETMLERAIGSIDWLEHPRAQAYAVLGLAHVAADVPALGLALQQLGDALVDRYDAARDERWEWFEPRLTYDNARLPEALLRAGTALGDARMVRAGLATLAFLESIVFEGEIFVPVGNDGWYTRGGPRARFAQQPLEATSMVDAELAAFAATGERAHLQAAQRAAAWFDGGNLLGVPMVAGGGCYDGLEEGGPNRNMGAESTLAYLSAAYTLAIAAKPQHPKVRL